MNKVNNIELIDRAFSDFTEKMFVVKQLRFSIDANIATKHNEYMKHKESIKKGEIIDSIGSYGLYCEDILASKQHYNLGLRRNTKVDD